MLTHDLIPPRLNGYDVIASCPVATDSKCSVIIGRDLSRRLPSYVTAIVSKESIACREWFWGHYFDGEDKLEEAMRDFIDRVGTRRAREMADLKRQEQRHESDV